jgi:predicted DsbA family dithiol-disulfide isomerase
MKLTIDVVSDVVCPWCFIGKRHLDRALELWREEQPDCAVTVRWRPFFLNPDTPEAGEPYRPFLERKFGGPKQLEELWQRVGEAGRPAGIAFAFEKIELRANTLNAHRLIHHAQTVMPTAKPETASLADGAGGTAIADLVEALFARRKGINGVPFFIFNNRLAASGAQPPQALLQVMRQAAQEGAAAA